MTETAKPRISRRALLSMISGGVAAFGAAAGIGYLLGDRASGPKTWQPIGDRPLRLLSGQDDTVNGQRRLLIDRWNVLNPNYPAEMVELPGVADLQYSEIHATLQAEDPSVDVVNLDVPWIAEFASRGYLHPLQDPDIQGFLERPLQAGRHGGRLYALPFNTDTGMLYYRAQTEGSPSEFENGLLTAEDAADITSWDRLREVIETVLQEDVLQADRERTPAKFSGGIAMQLASYEGFTVNVWEYLLANGIETDADTGMIDFGVDAATEQLATLASDLRDNDELGIPPLVLRAALHHREAESLQAFQNSATPFLRHWPRAYRVLSCGTDFAVGMVPMPGGVLGGQNLAVSAFSERKEAAQGLVRFLTSEDSQRVLFDRGGFAATREDPYLTAVDAPAADPDDCEEVANLWPDVAPLYSALTGEWIGDGPESAGANPGARPTVERYTQFSRAFRDYLHARIEGGPDPSLGGLESYLDGALDGR